MYLFVLSHFVVVQLNFKYSRFRIFFIGIFNAKKFQKRNPTSIASRFSLKTFAYSPRPFACQPDVIVGYMRTKWTHTIKGTRKANRSLFPRDLRLLGFFSNTFFIRTFFINFTPLGTWYFQSIFGYIIYAQYCILCHAQERNRKSYDVHRMFIPYYRRGL